MLLIVYYFIVHFSLVPGWRGLVLAAYVWLYFDVTGIWPGLS